MGIHSTEIWYLDCDGCGDNIIPTEMGYESNYDIYDALGDFDAYEIDDDIMCSSCMQEYVSCETCEELVHQDDAIYCDACDDSCAPMHDNDRCVRNAHRDFNPVEAETFGYSCPECGIQYGKTLEDTFTVKDPLPGFSRAEKEAV